LVAAGAVSKIFGYVQAISKNNNGFYDYTCYNDVPIAPVRVSATTSTPCDTYGNSNCYCEGTCASTNIEGDCYTNDNQYCVSCGQRIVSCLLLSAAGFHDVNSLAEESFSTGAPSKLSAVLNGKIISESFMQNNPNPCYEPACTNAGSICSGKCYAAPHIAGVSLMTTSGAWQIFSCGVSDGVCPDSFSSGVCGATADPDCAICNNGIKEGSEQCDGSVPSGLSCASYAFPIYNGGPLGPHGNIGSLSCTSSCTIDSSKCGYCGNGVREGVEQCDEGVSGGSTCTSSCTLKSCGNGVREGAEQCDLGSGTKSFSPSPLVCNNPASVQEYCVEQGYTSVASSGSAAPYPSSCNSWVSTPKVFTPPYVGGLNVCYDSASTSRFCLDNGYSSVASYSGAVTQQVFSSPRVTVGSTSYPLCVSSPILQYCQSNGFSAVSSSTGGGSVISCANYNGAGYSTSSSPTYSSITCNGPSTGGCLYHNGAVWNIHSAQLTSSVTCDGGPSAWVSKFYNSAADGTMANPITCSGGPSGNGAVCTCNTYNGIPCSYCSNSCTIQTVNCPYCGDGIKNGAEQCDDGAGNSNNGRCLKNCSLSYCGDGHVQVPNSNNQYESCDNGVANGPAGACKSDCTSNSCTISSLSIIPVAGCNGTVCSQGSSLSVSMNYAGYCSSAHFAQVDFSSIDSSCKIQGSGVQMPGLNSFISLGPGVVQFNYVLGSIPDACADKSMSPIPAAALYTDSSRSTVASNYFSTHGNPGGQIILDQCIAPGRKWSLYGKFLPPESPIFNVLNVTGAPPYPAVCVDRKYIPVVSLGQKVFSSPRVTVASTSYPLCVSSPILQYCQSNGYSAVSSSTGGGSVISCANYNGAGYSISSSPSYSSITCSSAASGVNIAGTPYPCSAAADGICPDDFISGTCSSVPDADCGTHIYEKCANVTLNKPSDSSYTILPPPGSVSCTPPSPTPHMACDPFGCVYNDGTTTKCYAYGDIISTANGNILCSDTNTWCPENFGYKPAKNFCFRGTAVTCDEGFSGSPSVHGCSAFSSGDLHAISYALSSSCVSTSGSKITGVCLPSTHWGNYWFYDFQNVIVK
jgi:hypothetical protein